VTVGQSPHLQIGVNGSATNIIWHWETATAKPMSWTRSTTLGGPER
jgi:hypothetical protein